MGLKNIIILFVVLSVMPSCGSKKTVADNRPSWIKERPLSGVEYIGIGRSSKIKSPYSYLILAKNNALNDISSEISVNVSSSSVLSSVETQQGFVDSYSSLIKSKTKNDLEGYELVNTYETDTDYWCYYKLNKKKYSDLRKKKKQSAILKSLDFYKKSTKARSQNNLKSSILLNIKAIDALKDYWTEDIEVEFNGENFFLGNELIANQNTLINSIYVNVASDRIIGVRGKSIPSSLLSFTLVNERGVKQGNIPVIFRYSDGRISKRKSISSNEGKISYTLKKLKSDKNNVDFRCAIDLPGLIDEATSNYMLHRLLGMINAPEGKVDISIKNPIMYISSNEKLLGDDKELNDLTVTLADYFHKKGLKTTNTKIESDFEIVINSDTKRISRNNDGVYTSELSVSIKMFSDNELVYTTNISEVYGRGVDYKNASSNAYLKADSDVRFRVGNQLYRCVFD